MEIDQNLRKLLIEMCDKHALSGGCGPDCICQEMLDELEPARKERRRLLRKPINERP